MRHRKIIPLAVRSVRGEGIKNKDNPDELSCLVAGGGKIPRTIRYPFAQHKAVRGRLVINYTPLLAHFGRMTSTFIWTKFSHTSLKR